MSGHINAEGEFQSDKYPWCKPGFVPLKITDRGAQKLLWAYAEQRREIDAAFADDLQFALKAAGYQQPARVGRKTVMVRMPVDLVERIDRECRVREERSREQVIRDLCSEAIDLSTDARAVGSRAAS